MDKEALLLDRARAGDMDAFVELFEPLRKRIHGVALRLTGPNDADDVTMDTFLRAWQGLPAFDGRASLSTWLCRIARYCALDRLRRRAVRRAQSLDGDEDGLPIGERLADPAALSPAAAAERADQGVQIESALARLPAGHRQVVELRYMDDLSYAEIAAALELSMGTVMSRLFHGRAKLRKMMRDCDPEPGPERNETS